MPDEKQPKTSPRTNTPNTRQPTPKVTSGTIEMSPMASSAKTMPRWRKHSSRDARFPPRPGGLVGATRKVCSRPCNETGTPSDSVPSSAEFVADARAGALGKLDYVAAQAFATALIAVAASSSQRTTHYARPGDSARRPSSAPWRSIRDSRPARRFGARRDGAPVRRSPRRAVRRNASSATPVFRCRPARLRHPAPHARALDRPVG
jgi:hypothetical protein